MVLQLQEGVSKLTWNINTCIYIYMYRQLQVWNHCIINSISILKRGSFTAPIMTHCHNFFYNLFLHRVTVLATNIFIWSISCIIFSSHYHWKSIDCCLFSFNTIYDRSDLHYASSFIRPKVCTSDWRIDVVYSSHLKFSNGNEVKE